MSWPKVKLMWQSESAVLPSCSWFTPHDQYLTVISPAARRNPPSDPRLHHHKASSVIKIISSESRLLCSFIDSTVLHVSIAAPVAWILPDSRWVHLRLIAKDWSKQTPMA